MSDAKQYGAGTIVGLSEALARRLEEVVKDLRLPPQRDASAPRVPLVIRGFPPTKRANGEAEQPFVIVCPADGQVESYNEHRVRVGIVVGVFEEEDFAAGADWLLVFAERIIQSLQEKPTLEKRYVLRHPISWNIMFDQPYPLWQLEMMTEWVVQAPVILPDEGVV